MAPLTSSFIADVEEAVLAEVLRWCGTGAEAWDEPDYLQLQTVRRGRAILPGFDLADSELPAFVMDYQLYEQTAQHVGAFDVKHRWLCGAKVKLNPTICGYTANPTEAAFRRCVIASADLLLKRLDEVLDVFSPGVVDTVFPESSGARHIPWGQIYLDWASPMECMAHAVLEYNLTAMRRRRSS